MSQKMFYHWTELAKDCYERGMNCEGCPNDYVCSIPSWNRNPYRMRNIKYAVIQLLKNVGEPSKMRICDCKKHLEFSYTLDKMLPNGNVESIAVYECSVCGKLFTEEELKENSR